MRIDTAFASYDVEETDDGRLSVQLVGSGEIRLVPTRYVGRIEIEAPPNRKQRHKTLNQMRMLRCYPATANALGMPQSAPLRMEAEEPLRRVGKLPDRP